mmetsp:Transcript_43729/g.78505  ORF Transcript_43729/g.78505 Transcript_43729/m.78505 type:complete len:280 (+) Transcript_43729:78-917(+)
MSIARGAPSETSVPKLSVRTFQLHQTATIAQPPIEVETVNHNNYDVCTAPVLPAQGDGDVKMTRKQIASLRSRIERGGEESVLSHYRSVVQEMEASLSAAGRCSNKNLVLPFPPKVQGISMSAQSVRKRVGSGNSHVSTASTRWPSGDDSNELLYGKDWMMNRISRIGKTPSGLNLQQGNAIRVVSHASGKQAPWQPPAMAPMPSKSFPSSLATLPKMSTPVSTPRAVPHFTRPAANRPMSSTACSRANTGGAGQSRVTQSLLVFVVQTPDEPSITSWM